MKQFVTLLIITGPVGVGKSTVADAVYETLKEQALPIALINLDELGYANVDPDDPYKSKLRFKNLQSVWENYAAAGIKYLVIPAVVETKADIERFSKAIPGANLSVGLLVAPLATLKERLTNRMLGGSLDWHLTRAEELVKVFDSSDIADFVINTDNQRISEVTTATINNWLKSE